MTALPLLTFDEAQRVGERVHDHWVRMTGEAPVPRDNFAWADLVQFVTRAACERLVEREVAGDEVPSERHGALGLAGAAARLRKSR